MEDPADLEAMIAVLDALGASGSPDALAVVREALSHPTPALRQAAARALATLGGEAPPVDAKAPPAPAPAPAASAAPAVDWRYLARLGTEPRWVLETNRGTVVVRLDPDEAPLTVQTLARLSQEGRYDGVRFHRVVPNFVVQGGDVASRDGFGGPGFTITSEFTEVPYLRGGAGMASAGKDTEGSQFFFTHSMQPHLDGSYTTFGWVVSGMDVVDRLDIGDRILRATVERGG
jgi:peptidylprolyl isomerase